MYARSETIGDPEYLSGTLQIVRLFRQMLETGQPSVPYDDALERVALLDAGLRAHESRQRVFRKDVMKS